MSLQVREIHKDLNMEIMRLASIVHKNDYVMAELDKLIESINMNTEHIRAK